MAARAYNIITRVLGLLLILVLACILAVQHPKVQTRLTRKVVNLLEEKCDALVEIGEVKVMPLGAFMVKDIVILDRNPIVDQALERGLAPADTFFRAAKVSATISLKGILRKEGLHIGRATLKDAMIHICDEPGRETKTNIQRIFNIPPPPETPREKGNVFDIRKVRAENVRYRMYNFKMRQGPLEGGVHFDDLDVLVTSIRGHGMRFAGGLMFATLDEAEFYEKRGVHCTGMTGKCTVGKGMTTIENFHLVDEWSDVRLKHYTMTYANTRSFKNYIDEVRMSTHIEPSVLSWKSVSLWSGVMQDCDMVLDIKSADAEGYVSDLTLNEFDFTELGSGISAQLKGSVQGLPDVRNITTDLDISGMSFTSSELSRLVSAVSPKAKVSSIRKLAPGRLFNFSGHASGPVSKLSVQGRLTSKAGNLIARGKLRNLLTDRPVELDGTVDLQDVDASLFSGSDLLGRVTAKAALGAKLRKGRTSIRLDSLNVGSLVFNGREYKGIDIDGSFDGNTISGRVSGNDPDLSFALAGSGSLKPAGGAASYKLSGTLDRINLKELKLDSREGLSTASGRIDADIDLLKNGMLDGTLSLGDIVLSNSEGEHRIGDIDIEAAGGDGQEIILNSSFADASFQGTGPVGKFISDIQALTTRRHIPALYSDTIKEVETGTYDIALNCHDSRTLMSFVLPGVYVADSTIFRMSVDEHGTVRGNLGSPRLAYGAKFLKDAELAFDNTGDRLNASILGSRLTSGTLDFQNPAITAEAEDNGYLAKVKYDGFSGISEGGELFIDGEFSRNSGDSLQVTARPQNSYLRIGSGIWEIGHSEITASGKDIRVSGFSLVNGLQKIFVDGGISNSRSDTLAVHIENLDLALVDEFTEKDYGIRGKANGRAFINSPTGQQLGMLMNFNCDSLFVGGHDAGSIRVGSTWNDEEQRLNIFMRNTVDGADALYARAAYRPEDKGLEGSAKFDRFSLATLTPFLDGVFSEMDGNVIGEVKASGTLENPVISGEGLTLDNALLRVAYTGVPYIVNGNVGVATDRIILNSLDIRDNDNGRGTLSGEITYKGLSNMDINARLDINNLLVVDSPDNGDNQLYGHLAASGNATVKGPARTLQIDANLQNAGDGEIHVPLGGSLTSTSSNLLTFKEKEKPLDPYEEMLYSYVSSGAKPMDLIARGRVNINDDLRAFVEIDKAAGNIVSFNGNGNVNLDLHTSKSKFDLNGDYRISNGSYRFAIPGIINKDFDIQDGSTVKFNGNIMDTDLDINALYNVKTSLSTLIADSTVVASRRLVECGLNITNKLRNPEVDFSINIPDLDPTTKSAVESALNTEDKIQKQFIALLLMGSFIPEEISGVINGTNMLYSNMAEVLSNQLNSRLQKLEIPFDLGIDYQGTRTGSNIFDVAISTQLFNNRVEINGSVGNRMYSTSKNANGDVVGDLDISVKLDKPGKFRLNIFSHSADEYTSYLDFSQRNGLGLSYQKEYNRLLDFLRSLVSSKEKREQKAREEAEAGREPVIIKIGND